MRYLVGVYEGKEEWTDGPLLTSFQVDAADDTEAKARGMALFREVGTRTPAECFVRAIPIAGRT